MKSALIVVATACLSIPTSGQTELPASQTAFPRPDFVLHDPESKQEKPRVVLGPMKTDSSGKATGSFAVYGGSSLVQVSSLSFSRDGKLLAVANYANPARFGVPTIHRGPI
jgi:hypothetical protein